LKRFRALVLVLVLVEIGAALGACTQNAPQKAPAPPAPPAPAPSAAVRFLALGDSFTIGTGATPERAFPARLVDRWRSGHAGCTLVLENLAVNGYTTEDLITVELPRLGTFHPTFVTVAIGANDIVSGTTEAAYRSNVRRILEAVKGSGARIVVVPQPDWSHSPAAASFGAPDALAATIARFNAALADEARASGAEWVDLVPLMHDQANAKQLANDGLHPSADAYDAWAAELARVVKSPCS
jgi:acyl-CoA thioesterase-1